MTPKQEFFKSSDMIQQLRETILLIERSGIRNSDQLRLIKDVLVSMVDSSDEWDNLCQHTVKTYGGQFRIALKEIRDSDASEAKADLLIAFVYLFLMEIDLSMKSPLHEDFLKVRSEIEAKFKDSTDRAGTIISYGQKQLPITILKSFLNSSEMMNFKDVEKTALNLEAKVTEWKKELTEREKQVTNLKETLDTYTDAFNFVGLYKGFSNLEISKKSDLKKQMKNLKFFGFLMILPAAIDFYLIASEKVTLDLTKPAPLIAGAIASVTLTLLFMYFFRIVLRDVDSKEAQIVQITLRMTLCQFIQKYAEYASEISAKSPDILSKFENIIFSGIVGTQDKLPSTFDGLDQIAALGKALRGKE